jgi:hypothetical protein
MNLTALLKILVYVFLTALITFVALLDTISAEQINMFTCFDWLKLTIKALVPGLVSIKAYLDNSFNPLTTVKPEVLKNEEQ